MAKLLDVRTIVHHLSVGLRYSITDADVNQPRVICVHSSINHKYHLSECLEKDFLFEFKNLKKKKHFS